MPQLRLGPLPKVGVFRLEITLPESLKEELDLYSAEHGRLYEPIETAALIPHMLEAFIRSDRGWRSRRAKAGGARQRGLSPPASSTTRGDETLP
ncbi:DUF2274 domain-containing protein [Agrobacterium vitis]|uniref:DUF2274 domain-containing protein n=1 Tax=Agrobacterium vitis TaxID=373 RepID=A0A368NX61_AGRVI|nr:DUF2274 domain-containing protein [Agrobacterium vitis]KAA3513714.1 DUF2274 domain-containing protein [Agrobacterium vitis]KAA3528295.1 DUF2274 domain-containing protein [Agrobacterium vitis]MUZ97863.1 DUF2274 domain-containing protein [Agrobacterium vitis]MVA30640.1 DUF2274 domain-containing protein [Agrobacterium vitis]NOJ35590.1 DUF2274 domain-containing protein [Agrobacterium vitis]